MDSINSNQNKDSCSTNPIKQAHRMCEKTFVVIHESLVGQLNIDENTWFEQILEENGIFLRIRRCCANRNDIDRVGGHSQIAVVENTSAGADGIRR